MSDVPPAPPSPATHETQVHEVEWQRLDPRMLLVHPIREVVRFLPVLIGLAVAGTASGGAPWQLLGVAVPVALGIGRYLTTRFRVADGRVELRRGLLSRRVSSTPIDRVRTVDLTSSLVQRVLGLTTLRIGTGQQQSDGEGLDLDGLPHDRARALRGDLLRASAVADAPGHPEGPAPGVPGVPTAGGPWTAPPPVPPLVTFDPAWLRFAPFTGTGLVVALAVLGGGAQLLDAFDVWQRLDRDDVPAASTVGLVVGGVVVLLVVLALSVVGFLVANGGFRLSREHGSWHVARGLLTTRETSIDEERLAGVALGEPLALRVAGGRHLQAIVTGIDRNQMGAATLVPPSPADVAPRVAARLLGDPAPVEAPLVGHGRRAATRRWVRALVPAAVVAAVLVAVAAAGGPWWLLVPAALVLLAAAALAADRVRGLGHALVAGHLVARSGSLNRSRQMLDVGHVIGFTLRSTWFQRRAGLTTLVATTAGGSGAVGVLDVPTEEAVRVADEAIPGLVSQFLAHP
ncbi:PH domain-containing protein [Nocardioides marinquilinus]|uniref:PH domain-containing protein n=1 Tax=Nocardioides marinquilinus TaxID=1210400 RepID=A0ABP9PKR1_9ACTN